MSFKCPDCGATLTDDSRFCKYCGAKIDDGIKRMEIKIDKRIEDVAEVKRASYEEQESLLRQQKMKQELKKGKSKRIAVVIALVLSLLPFLVAIVSNSSSSSVSLAATAALGLIVACLIVAYVLVSVIKGTW